MKSLREQFEDDYAAVKIPAKNKAGFKIRYVYYAPWYIWNLPEPVLKRKKLLLTCISVGNLFLFILAGVQETGLNHHKAVELTVIFALCTHVLELFSIVQFLFANYMTSRMTYSYINKTLKSMPFIRGFCLLATVMASIYYTLQNELHFRTFMIAICYLICALMALYVFWEYRKIPFKTEKNIKIIGR